MKVEQIAVINTNEGLVRDVLYVANGKFYVDGDVTNNEDNVGFSTPILFKDILSVESTAYSAGAQRVRKINFDAAAIHGFTKDVAYPLTIKAGNGYKQTFTVYAPDAVVSPPKSVMEGVRDAFYNLLNKGDYPFTVALSTDLLTITGKFGTTALDAVDFTIDMPWVSAATPMTATLIADSGGGGKTTITKNNHGLAVGDIVKITDVTWTVPPTNGDFDPDNGYVITDITTHTFKIVFDFSGATYDSGGTITEVAQCSTTAYAKPIGTPSIIETYGVDASLLTGNTYDQYLIKYQIQIPGAPNGHYSYKDVNALLFIENSLTVVESLLGAILLGDGTTGSMSAAIDQFESSTTSVVTATSHAFTNGDLVILGSCTDHPELNGCVFEVYEVIDEDNFIINLDASGWEGAESAAQVRLFNASILYNAK